MSKKKKDTSVIDYNVSSDTSINRLTSWLIGFAAGFVIFFVFYKIILLSVIGGVLIGTANIFLSSKKNIEKRKMRLRTQFYDLLEAMSVSMRAGNPPYKALISAREDLMLLYPEKSDIIRELDLIIGKFNNAVPLSEAFSFLPPHPTKLAAIIVSANSNAKFLFFIHFSSITSFFEFRFTKKIFSVFFTHSIIITDSIILFVYYVKILTAFFYCFIIF